VSSIERPFPCPSASASSSFLNTETLLSIVYVFLLWISNFKLTHVMLFS